MKIYVSGKISGLPIEEAKKKFEKAKEHLTMLGYEVVNPLNNGLDESASWESHMLADINLLFGCEAIYLLPDWISSRGAMIEKNVAQVRGLKIFFESKEETDKSLTEKAEMTLFKIEAAIQEVTGLSLHEYSEASRSRSTFYARLIYSHHCKKQKIRLKVIADKLKRDHTTVLYSLQRYADEVKYNPEFRQLANGVEEVLILDEALV